MKLFVSYDYLASFQAFRTFSYHFIILSLLKYTLLSYLLRVYFKLKRNLSFFMAILRSVYSHLMQNSNIRDRRAGYSELFNFKVDF
jgi:hypothetical protein